MGKVKSYLIDNDEFGGNYALTYEGNETHGTALGGCFTMIARVFFYGYLTLTIVKLLTSP